MRKILFIAAAAAMCVGLAACDKEKIEPTMPTGGEAPTQMESLNNTTWKGEYLNEVSYQGYDVEMTLTWTVDFLTDSTGSLLAEVTSPVSAPQENEIDFSYSVDGNVGHIFVGGAEDTFDIDPVNQTITMDMQLPVNLGENASEQTVLGGVTTLYRIR